MNIHSLVESVVDKVSINEETISRDEFSDSLLKSVRRVWSHIKADTLRELGGDFDNDRAMEYVATTNNLRDFGGSPADAQEFKSLVGYYGVRAVQAALSKLVKLN